MAIGFSKLLHELGHAYTAARYGCRVPVMGLAFMAMLPMPYTDVSDAWRLSSKQQRLAIGAAGMITEIALAIIATFAWNFLPDGPVRSAAFLLSSSTWLITLSVNLSPLMRFDGYYLLSDAWGIENLQARAFAIARWRLRCWLFADNQEPPEILPKATMSKMVVYSYITWLYRLIVFTGLALLVYHFFFKLLGIVLFAVEIVWFIAKPIIAEFKQWRLLAKQAIPLKHPKLIVLSVIFIVVGLITPWHDTVYLPAILRAERHTTLYPPQPARIAQVLVTPGQRVTQGQLLFKLESPKLEDDIFA
ncbi:site-2 protease family protein [Methylocucumis oryzae]|uniref:site-2 protease family protein n=1 Tax=Methylocucumis oryzae TaxID=1632867 RepID=UPI0006976419|nr:site-2 protease family protein [Methylocucumis oryzae]